MNNVLYRLMRNKQIRRISDANRKGVATGEGGSRGV